MKRIWLAVCFVLLPIASVGQTVTVRGGEHDGFTRLVLDLPRKVAWSIVKEDAMILTLEGLTPNFEVSSAMQRLSAGRVLAVNVGQEPATLAVALNCECEVQSFYASQTMLVIDFYGSPGANPVTGVSPTSEESNVATVQQPSRDVSGFQLPLILPNDTASKTQSIDMANLGAESSQLFEEQIDRARRSRDVERSLLTEMGRVASQGLVEPHLTLPEVEKFPKKADQDSIVENVPASLAKVPDGQNIRAFSSADRDFLLSQETLIINRNGQRCMEDELLALQDWVSDEGFGKQTGMLRTQLFGEFDKPDPVAAQTLAQAYIGYGLGIEAAQVLNVVVLQEANTYLFAMADIVEDGVLTGEMPATWYLDCETPASFWALLAGAQTRSDMPLNKSSVISSFSALPAQLRAHLGPFLTARLQSIGEERLLSDVVRHMERGQPDDVINVALVSAQAELVAGEPESAAGELEKVIAANREDAPKALAQKIDMLVDQEASVPVGDIDLIEAFALEYRQDPIGPNLALSAVLARASAGNFDESFLELALLTSKVEQDKLIDSASFVLTRLSQTPDDVLFLEYAFSPEAEKLQFSSVAEHEAARRLIDLGFAGRALVYLSSATQPEMGRERKLLRAEAALGLGRMRQAEAELLGLHGTDVEALRVKAKIGQQDYQAAQIVFETLGDNSAAAEQAWLGEDWTGLRGLDAAELEGEQALLELDESADRAPSLANSEELLRESDELRDLVADVLARHALDAQLATR